MKHILLSILMLASGAALSQSDSLAINLHLAADHLDDAATLKETRAIVGLAGAGMALIAANADDKKRDAILIAAGTIVVTFTITLFEVKHQHRAADALRGAPL